MKCNVLLRKIWSIYLIPFLITIGLIIQGLKMEKGVKDNSTRYSSHLLWFADDRDRRNHLPTSSRLHFLQFYYFEQEYNHAIHPLVTQLIEKDRGQGVEFSIPPAKKKKENQTHFFTYSFTSQ